jgi:hypothetical protein
MRRLAIALLCALALSGCFESETPLFGTKDAVYPIASGSRYKMLSFDKGVWKEGGRITITRMNDWYMAKPDDGKKDDSLTFILKQWGKNYLAAARTPQNDKSFLYDYAIIRIARSGTLYEYVPACKELHPIELQKRGLVKYEPGFIDTCVPLSFAALETAMRMTLDSGHTPDVKYIPVK